MDVYEGVNTTSKGVSTVQTSNARMSELVWWTNVRFVFRFLYFHLYFRMEVRYHQVIVRARFDAERDEKDPRKVAILLAEGCRELWRKRSDKTVRCKMTVESTYFHLFSL